MLLSVSYKCKRSCGLKLAIKLLPMAILPLFRRDDIPTGIEAGASMIIGKVTSEMGK